MAAMDASDTGISLFNQLRVALGSMVQPIRCRKATLVHLSHTLEDLVLQRHIPALLFTGFQKAAYWQQEAERYHLIAEVAELVCIFAANEFPSEDHTHQLHITLKQHDRLCQEWFVLILSTEFTVLLCAQDRLEITEEESLRQFDTILSFDQALIHQVVDQLEEVISIYRPERLAGLQTVRALYPASATDPALVSLITSEMIRYEEHLHQRLHQTLESLHKQARWREDLTNTIANNMRSPLNNLSMALELLSFENTFDPAVLKRATAIALRSICKMRDMAQVILTIDKNTNPQLPIFWQHIPLTEFIEEATQPIIQIFNSKLQIFQIQKEQTFTFIWGDRELLIRMLQNLIENAMVFTPTHGRIMLQILLIPDEQQIEFVVSDSGPGINPSNLPYILERQTKLVEQQRQIGFGLYFSRLVAEAHGGTITIQSSAHTGTTIRVRLPRIPPD